MRAWNEEIKQRIKNATTIEELQSLEIRKACAPAVKVIEKEVYVKCPVPDVPKTEKPQVSENATYPEKLKALLDYLFALEKENEILREVVQACKQ